MLFFLGHILIPLVSSYSCFMEKNRSTKWGPGFKTHAGQGQGKLITGAASFMSAHVTLALKKSGYGVLGLVNSNDLTLRELVSHC
ncbi:hypothetical protein SUGI_0563140 [Cryptomeria japonica]|nr:hypothetical protein SUGI_0563140 [Cryptomeria japonica]